MTSYLELAFGVVGKTFLVARFKQVGASGFGSLVKNQLVSIQTQREYFKGC